MGTFWKLSLYGILISLLASGLMACGGGGGGGGGSNADTSSETPTAATGQELFENRMSSGNTFACATCHALTEPASDGIRRPGHSLENVTRRPHYKNGQLTAMLDAVNSCLSEWMNAPTWTEDNTDWQTLFSWFDDQATVTAGEADPVPIQIVDPPTDLSGGDATAGQTLFNSSCVVCHGENGVGTERAPQVGGLGLSSELVGRRVRTSGRVDSGVYEGLTGGIMPFWGADRISDDELRDLTAYLALTGENATTAFDSSTSSSDSTCTSNHSRVGQTAELSTFSHNVSGTAEIVDDCTITIRNFNYDGGGIVVEIYGGTDGEYNPPTGFSISGDLKDTLFENESLTLTLPTGVTLDDFNGISVWCVAVGVSFGDGLFQ